MMAAPTRKRLETNIDGVVASTSALVQSIRSITRTDENTTEVPGWRIVHPNPSELREIREVQVLEATPGGDEYPFFLPRDANTTVMVESGSVSVYGEHGEPLGDLEHGKLPYFNKIGSVCSIKATVYPTSVLLVSYRERAAGGTEKRT